MPAWVLRFVIATDLVMCALALGLYAGVLPTFHPVLRQVPPVGYLLAAIVFGAGAVITWVTQKRLRRERPPSTTG